MSDGGKGDKQRPTDKKKFDDGWERIFGKPKDKPDDHKEEKLKL